MTTVLPVVFPSNSKGSVLLLVICTIGLSSSHTILDSLVSLTGSVFQCPRSQMPSRHIQFYVVVLRPLHLFPDIKAAGFSCGLFLKQELATNSAEARHVAPLLKTFQWLLLSVEQKQTSHRSS